MGGGCVLKTSRSASGYRNAPSISNALGKIIGCG